MPPGNTAESFLWRAAQPQPQRVRLLGAIAIALSCTALGVLFGRWSVERVPSEPGTRTAALIAAVAKETRDKLADAAKEPAGEAPAQSGPPPVAPAASGPPGASSPATSSPNAAARPEPRAAPASALAEESAGETAPVSHAAPPSGARELERQRPPAVAPVVPEVRRPLRRPAPQETTAPDYRALRDYVLSR